MTIFDGFNAVELHRSIVKKHKKLSKENKKFKKDMDYVLKVVPEQYHIVINKTVLSFLNPFLVIQQKLTDKDLRDLIDLHIFKYELFEAMEISDPDNPPRENFFKDCVEELEKIEFRMQKSWGFSEDRNFHSWWYRAPHCQCPVLDNAERFGTSYRIINENCPLHGKK